MQSKTSFPILPCLGALGLTLAAVYPANADPFLPVPPASFLNYHVASAEQLSQEVALDAIVRARLARHFHQAEPEVSRYIHDNLILTHLSKPGQFRVACVTPSGREYYLTQSLAAGTGVFSLRSTGKPILKQACGNPLVAVLPAVAPKKVAPPQLAATPKAVPIKPAVTAMMPSDVVFTDVPPLEAAKTGNIGPFVKVAGITQSLGRSGGGSFFPAVLGVAGLGLFTGHHGSSSPSPVPAVPVMPVVPTLPAPSSPTAPAGTTPTSPTVPVGTVPVTPAPIVPAPTTPVTQTPTTPTVPVTPTPITPTTPPSQTPPSQTPPTDTPPVFTPPTITPPFSPPTFTPPVTTPPFIGPPPVTPPSQSAVPEPGPVVIFGLGGTALALLRLRARRRRA